MYRGINGTPPSRALSCSTTPTPRNHHRPPSTTSFSFCAFSLSRLRCFSPSVPSFSSSSSLTATPSNPLPSFQLHPSLSLYYMYARMYICTSFCLASLAPRSRPQARRLTTLTPLRPPSYSPAQHTSQIGSRATLYPVPVCTAAGRGAARYCPDRGMQRLEDARIHT